MNNLYFYLLLGIILYLLFTRVLENYIVSQENFDPSLVPVSSIVTLAKVAQKLVNGNGTLTNPGNLQIGASTGSPGNLTVTGNGTVSGTMGITGNTTVGGTMGITGNTTVGGTMGITGNTTVGGTMGITGATTIGGTLGVGAKLTLPHSVWHQSNDGKNRLHYGNNSHTYFGTGDRYYWRANNDTDLMQLDGFGNTTIKGGLKVEGSNGTFEWNGNTLNNYLQAGNIKFSSNGSYDYINATNNLLLGSNSGTTQIWGNDLKLDGNKTFCIGSTCINETHLKMLTGAQSISFDFNTSNTDSNNAAGSGKYLGTCGGAPCGGGATVTSTTEANRRASLYMRAY